MEIQKETKPYQKPADDNFVEAEIVDDGKNSSRNKNTSKDRIYNSDRNNKRKTRTGTSRSSKKAFSAMKYKIMGVILVVGIALTLFGFILTSTIIGAIIGIPLMILGISLLSLFGKLLFSKKNPAIFKTFRF
jgi:hypothetical protein